MRLNHVGLAGLSRNLQAALSATARWHLKRVKLVNGSRHALGTDVLHVLPVEDNADNS